MSSLQSSQSLFTSMLMAGISGSVAETFTLPFDTAKVRLQIQGETLSHHTLHKYRNFPHCIYLVLIEEGPRALWQGLPVALIRQMVYSGFRVGSYSKVRDFLGGENKGEGFIQKIAAGMMCGAFGIFFANPTDVIKVRFQSQERLPGTKQRYTSVFSAFIDIYRNEGGPKALMVGVLPNMIRNSIVNASLVATYDEIRSALLKRKIVEDNFSCYFLSSMLSGLISTIVSNPIEVLRVRIQNANKINHEDYKGIIHCATRILNDEGILTFYHGVGAFGTRLICYNICYFLTFEYLNKLYYRLSKKQEL